MKTFYILMISIILYSCATTSSTTTIGYVVPAPFESNLYKQSWPYNHYYSIERQYLPDYDPPDYLISNQPELTPQEARKIAKEAYIFGYPLVDNYRIMHAYYVDTDNPEYKAPFNQIKNIPRIYTPQDKAVQTPNSDTPYSWLGMDLHTEPVVITVPPIEKGRYYSIQLLDQYTYIIDYISSRTDGNEGGTYLISGPEWKGKAPEGITKVIASKTFLAVAVFRTQLYNDDDLENVKEIQSEFKSESLSSFLGQPKPVTSSELEFIQPLSPEEIKISMMFFEQLNFVLDFCPTHVSEEEMMARFAKIGVGIGKNFDPFQYSPRMQKAIRKGIADAWKEFGLLLKNGQSFQMTSDEIFGSEDNIKDNYLYRMLGSVLGIQGNDRAEIIYSGFYVDTEGKQLDGTNNYTMHFSPEQEPPVNAFWSMTMYEMPSKLLSENALNRYLLNSTTIDGYIRDEDGGLTLYFQHESPGKKLEVNWLPAPEGPFSVVLKLYWPKDEALDGSWIIPTMKRTVNNIEK